VYAWYGLQQHVTASTHVSHNLLDLILSLEQPTSAQLIDDVTAQLVCSFDHQLLTC